MGRIVNCLPDLMDRHGIKQKSLAEAAGLRYATLNAFCNTRSQNISFDTLGAILEGLNSITGKTYNAADILEYRDVPDETSEATASTSIPWQDIKAKLKRNL